MPNINHYTGYSGILLYPSTWEAEPGRSEVSDHPQLHSKSEANLCYRRPSTKQRNKVHPSTAYLVPKPVLDHQVKFRKCFLKPCNGSVSFSPSTQEAEAGGSLWVWGQPDPQKLVTEQAPKLQGTVSGKKEGRKEGRKEGKNERKKRKEERKCFFNTLFLKILKILCIHAGCEVCSLPHKDQRRHQVTCSPQHSPETRSLPEPGARWVASKPQQCPCLQRCHKTSHSNAPFMWVLDSKPWRDPQAWIASTLPYRAISPATPLKIFDLIHASSNSGL